jgi:regulator of sigma E protease
MSYLLAFLGFSALIVLHELGHFTAAKAVGMRVERFALFFPPLLFKIRRGETEYGVGAIPLGGYVRISGMTPHEELPPEVEHRAYYKQAVWKRIVVIAAGPAVNIVLALAILFGLYAFNGVPQADPANAEVSAVAKGSPAAAILRPGDRIVAVDGVRGDAEQLRARIATHRCAGEQRDGCVAATPAKLTIVRDGKTLQVQASPRYDATAKRPLLGFSQTLGIKQRDVSASEAARESVDRNWFVAKESVKGIAGVFYDSAKRKEVSGVVGSYEVTRQSFNFDTERALFVLALISLSLGIINLFPFLPLDGGHIFWALAEKARGKPIPFSVLERVSVVGFLLIAFMFVVGLSNDIGRLSDGGFQVR